MSSIQADTGTQPGRLKPQQSRSQRRVELVLHAAAGVLVDRGYEGTTLKEVADRAGIKQTSIYRYWPNKQQIVRDLVDGFIASQDAALSLSEGQLASGMHWRDVMADYIQRLRKTVETDKWISPCHTAIISDQELSDQDRKVQDHFAMKFYNILLAIEFPGDEIKRQRVGRMMALLIDSFVLSLNRHIKPDNKTIECEMIDIMEAYLNIGFDT